MIQFHIDGATCNGCVQSIEKALKQVTGVTEVSFNLDTKLAVVEGETNAKALTEAVEMAGFDVIDTPS